MSCPGSRLCTDDAEMSGVVKANAVLKAKKPVQGLGPYWHQMMHSVVEFNRFILRSMQKE